MESLRLGYERRRERLQKQLVEAEDPRIIRHYRGEVANREVAFERKLADLEAKRGVEVSLWRREYWTSSDVMESSGDPPLRSASGLRL